MNAPIKTTILALAITASACTVSPKLTGELAVFNWLQHANVEQDIKQAISQQDYRLIAIAGRGKAIPGLSLDIARNAKTRCNSKFVSGLGDNYRSEKNKEEYKKWWQKARAYAEAYNQKIIEYCLAKTSNINALIH